MSPRPSAPTFPPQDESERPSHADSSHVARRRLSSAPAHEVDVDEVELVDEEPPTLPSPSPPAPPTQMRVAASQPRLSPLPLPPRPSRPVFQVPLAPETVRRAHRLLPPIAGVLAAAATGVVVAFLWPPSAPRQEAPRAPLAPTPAAAPAVAANSSRTVPVVDVAKLPRAREGVVIGAEGHRLWIDGALAPSWQAAVGCGPHVVQVGSAGAPRTVKVPCGESVTVSP
jgi:hypothetical protein